MLLRRPSVGDRWDVDIAPTDIAWTSPALAQGV